MSEQKIARITSEELAKLMKEGTPLQIVDMRNPTAYGESDKIIPGAIRATFDSLEDVINSLDKDKEVVTYCT